MKTRPIRFVHRGVAVEATGLPPTTTVLQYLREQAGHGRGGAERHRRGPMRFVAAALLIALAGCASLRPAPAIVGVDAWGGNTAASTTPPQRIDHITIHHQGEIWKEGSDVETYLRRLQQWSRLTRHWADIPYHYVIGPDGRIYAARPLQQPGDTNTEYDPRGHALVMLVGNFEEQQPTPAQLNAAVELTAWLAREHHLGLDAIATHKDYSRQTVCPGRNLYAYFESGWFKAEVAKRL